MAAHKTKTTDPTPTEEAVEAQQTDAQTELIAGLTTERDQLKDQMLRALADLKNVRRRHEEDRRAMSLYATEDLVRELLPVLDNFERTLQAAESGADLEALTAGIQMVERQLRNALSQRHVVRIEALGQPFDPTYHEAIAHDDDPEIAPGTITAELEAGYRIGDRVLRPARVRVTRS